MSAERQPITPVPTLGCSVREAVELWLLDGQSRGLSRDTMRYYTINIRRFIAFCEGAAIGDVQDLTLTHLRRCFAQLRAGGVPVPTLAAVGGALRCFLNWAAREDPPLIDERVAAKFRPPRQPKADIQPFSEQQVQQLLTEAGRTNAPERDVALMLVLLDSGIRVAELCKLRDSDVIETGQGAVLRVYGKGSRWRRAPISTTTLGAIRAWQARRGPGTAYLFVPEYASHFGHQLDRKTVLQLFWRLQQKTGIEGVRVSPHTCRHTFAITWLRHGGDAFSLQKALGHSLIATTARYVSLASEDVERVHARLNLMGNISIAPTAAPPRPPRPEKARILLPLRERREARRLTTRQCAGQVGVSETYWRDLEKGRCSPGPAVAERIECWIKEGQG